MWPIATYPCDSLMTINAKYSFEVDLRNANICKTKVAKPLNTVAQCSAHNTDAKYWKRDNVFDQIKTNFQGVCLSPLVQGVDTNIFDGFGKEKYQRIICCQGKEGVGGATKRWNMQQWMQERGGRPLSLCSTHLPVANARDKRIYHGKTPLSDWLVDTSRFSGVDHFCFFAVRNPEDSKRAMLGMCYILDPDLSMPNKVVIINNAISSTRSLTNPWEPMNNYSVKIHLQRHPSDI